MELPKPLAFDWDGGNEEKSLLKHRVTKAECEEAFQDLAKVIFADIRHFDREERFILLGKTKQDRLLFISFTVRSEGTKVRIISARDINNKQEKPYYEKK